MGAEKVKKKPKKLLTDKKFVFDWHESEDTFREGPVPLPDVVHRGHLGGMDKSEEGKRKAKLYEAALKVREMMGPPGETLTSRM